MTQVPIGWSLTTLGKVNWPDKQRVKPGPDDRRPYLGMDSVEPHTGRVIRLARAGDFTSSAQVVQPGYTLYGRLRPYLNKVVEADFDGLCSAEFIAYPPRDWLAPKFLMYRLMAPDFQDFTASLNQGDRPRVNAEQIANFALALPPRPEQQRIVEKLEAFLSRIDALGRGLVESSRKTSYLVAHTIDLASRGPRGDMLNSAAAEELLQSSTSRKFDYSRLEGLPNCWVWRSAAQVCQAIVCGSTPQAKLMTPGSGDIPFLKVYNISPEGRLDFRVRPTFVSNETHNGQLARSKVFPGDVLTNIVGPPLGKTAVVPALYPAWNINQAIVAFRPGPELYGEWLALVLRSRFIIGKLKATARATAGQFNISLLACRELPIPVPPLAQQVDIVQQAKNQVSLAESAAASMESALRGTRKLRAASLAAAFRGDLL